MPRHEGARALPNLTLTRPPHLNLDPHRPPQPQVIAASCLYVGATLVFASPPLCEWRLVVGLVLGLKAQILFMAPFTAAFSLLIGGCRVTNGLATTLCLAPLIGAAMGTALTPFLLPLAGSPAFLLAALPALLAVALLVVAWRSLERMASLDERAKAKGSCSGGSHSSAAQAHHGTSRQPTAQQAVSVSACPGVARSLFFGPIAAPAAAPGDWNGSAQPLEGFVAMRPTSVGLGKAPPAPAPSQTY